MAISRTAQTSYPTGLVLAYGGNTVPPDWLACDGSTVSRTTYAGLFNAICPSKGTATLTGSNNRVTLNGHGLIVNDAVFFDTTTNGVTANRIYYVLSVVDSNTFTFSTSRGGSEFDITGTTGTATCYFAPYEIPDTDASNFKVPNLASRISLGKTSSLALGQTSQGTTIGQSAMLSGNVSADHTHSMSSHTHNYWKDNPTIQPNTGGPVPANATNVSGGDSHTHTIAHTHTTPDIVVKYIIKT